MSELRRYLVPLYCKIPNDELREYGKALAEQVQKCTDEEIRQGIQRKRMKEDLEALESERGRLAKLVADGVEKRDVECVVQADFVMNRAYTLRMDTGEVIDERDLKPDERQIGLEMEMPNGPQSVAPTPQREAPATQDVQF
jgi:hypothetical protein